MISRIVRAEHSAAAPATSVAEASTPKGAVGRTSNAQNAAGIRNHWMLVMHPRLSVAIAGASAIAAAGSSAHARDPVILVATTNTNAPSAPSTIALAITV